MRFLVTGGAGFIGSHLAEALLRQGHSVRILDSFVTGSRANLAYLRELARGQSSEQKGTLEMIVGDIRDRAVLRRSVRDSEIVLHHAALPSAPRSISAPEATHEVNATGTLNVLLACREAGVQRIVYASSASVYGDSGDPPWHEAIRTSPISPYGASKLAGEHYCRAFQEVYGLQTVCLRYFNVYGPRQNPNSQYAAVIPRFISALLRGEEATIFGDGLQTRDFTYVEDVVSATLLAALAEEATGVFNVGSGASISLLELLEQLREITEASGGPRLASARPGDIRHSLADIGCAGASLGYRPAVPLKEGLERTIQWFRRELRLARQPGLEASSHLRAETGRSREAVASP